MSSGSSSQRQDLDQILNQMPDKERGALDAARQQVFQFPSQGQSVSNEQAGQLPVGSTPSQAGKDLVYKYGRDPGTASREPERSLEPDR